MIRVRPADRSDLEDRDTIELVSRAMYEPTPQKAAHLLSTIDLEKSVVLVTDEGARKIGVLVAKRSGARSLEVEYIATARPEERKGAARALVAHLVEEHPHAAIGAETDDEAIGFYHSLGFRVTALGEKYAGRLRYRCTLDGDAWNPLPPEEAAARFQLVGTPCWVSGGWAVDLFLGRQTRPHEDTDLSIMRSDQMATLTAFRGWEVYSTHAPGLRRWAGESFLEDVPNLWLREDGGSDWRVEILLMDREDDRWVYRRDRAIRRPIDEIGLVSSEGLRYLRPEIQLLYKGGGTGYRRKDLDDLKLVLPSLSRESTNWLRQALATEFPGGHDWLAYIDDRLGSDSS